MSTDPRGLEEIGSPTDAAASSGTGGTLAAYLRAIRNGIEAIAISLAGTLAAQTQWRFACPAGGITDNAEHALNTAVPNEITYLHGCDFVSVSPTVETEVVILDKTGGAVVWRSFIHNVTNNAQAMPQAVQFDPPIASQPGQALVLQALTTGSRFYFNAQGTQG